MENENLTKSKKDKTLMIIIGVLSAVLIVLFVFFLMEKKENRENMIAITAEKEELQQELTDLSHHYDNLKTDNDTLNAKLVHEQEKIATLMDKMKKFRNDSYAEINRYKREIGTLKTVLRSYVVQIDSLNQLNQKLLAENKEVKKQMDWVRERNKTLEKKTEKMEETLEKANTLAVENFHIYPINKRDKETTLKKCFQLKADFTISRNITAKRGPRMIYLRITRPDGEVLAAETISRVKNRDPKINRKYVHIVTPPKYPRSVRNIPLNPEALHCLKIMDMTYTERNLVRSDFILTTDTGNLPTARHMQDTFDRILKVCNMQHYGTHSLRHTFATKLLEKTKNLRDIKTVAAIMGDDYKVIIKTYLHPDEDNKYDLVASL